MRSSLQRCNIAGFSRISVNGGKLSACASAMIARLDEHGLHPVHQDEVQLLEDVKNESSTPLVGTDPNLFHVMFSQAC